MFRLKQTITTNCLKHCLIATVFLLCACTPGNNKGGSGNYAIRSSSGEDLAVITISAEEISMKDNEGQLIGVAKRSDKRKYYNPSNSMIYAVKLDDDGFKLRNGNEQLIWKVKLYDDKLKVANNEEMTNAYEVKLYKDGKLKLQQNDKDIKAIRVSESKDLYDVDGQYQIQGFGHSLAPGILMIGDIGEREKFIIVAELAKRGR